MPHSGVKNLHANLRLCFVLKIDHSKGSFMVP